MLFERAYTLYNPANFNYKPFRFEYDMHAVNVRNIIYYFFICACLVIFFYFLQSDWLQQRAAFYDILTVVQKCYFLKTNQGVELIFELE